MAMDEQQFWQIVEEVHAASQGNMAQKCELLATQLAQLPTAEAIDFRNLFDALMLRAYHWPLMAAAYLIHGGCGDDTYSDFCSALISRGRRAFETALSDPDALADEPFDDDAWFFEGYQYAVTDGLRAHFATPRARSGLGRLLRGVRSPDDPLPPRVVPPLREPTGEPWSETDLAKLLPKLAQKFAESRDGPGGWPINVTACRAIQQAISTILTSRPVALVTSPALLR
jgi:Protein of unknown function (DUF4240)